MLLARIDVDVGVLAEIGQEGVGPLHGAEEIVGGPDFHYPRRHTLRNGDNHRVRKIAPDGVITTAAGTGERGFSGDGGPAAGATLNTPRGVTVDAKGNLYVLDAGNFRVRKVDPEGTIATVAGNGEPGFSGDGGPALDARLGQGFGIDSDGAGNLYITDVTNARIRKIDTQGVITTVAGAGPGPFSGDGGKAALAHIGDFRGPRGRRRGQSLYRRYHQQPDPQGRQNRGDSHDSGQWRYRRRPRGDVGRAVLSHQHCGRRRRYGLRRRVSTVAAKGRPGYSGDGSAATAAWLRRPTSVWTDRNGNLYISDSGNRRVRRVDRAGLITTVAGNGEPGHSGDGGPATSASLNAVRGIGGDDDGRLYLVERRRLRMVGPDGTVTTLAGDGVRRYDGDGGPALDAGVSPGDPAVDRSGHIFLAEPGNFRIRKIISPHSR